MLNFKIYHSSWASKHFNSSNSVHKLKVDLSKSTKPTDISNLTSQAKSVKREIPLSTNFFVPKKSSTDFLIFSLVYNMG